jgi:copper homeostasis protein
MTATVLFEACVDSVESAAIAEESGADRVELCAGLMEGGLTPSAGMIRNVCRHLEIPVHVIIRPRGADFCYSDAEFQVMAQDVELAGELGAAAVVLGILLPDGRIDTRRTTRLMECAGAMAVTFHRAFDVALEPLQALEELIELGVDTLLTSGQEATALEGSALIAQLVQQAAGRLQVMAGGGISERNVQRVMEETGVPAVHATLRTSVDSDMVYRSTRCPMGGVLRPNEYGRSVTSGQRVRSLLGHLR